VKVSPIATRATLSEALVDSPCDHQFQAASRCDHSTLVSMRHPDHAALAGFWTSTATILRSIGPSKTSQRTPSSAWIHCNPSPDLDLAPKPSIDQLLLHAPTPFYGTRHLTYTYPPTRPVCDVSLMIAKLAQVDGIMHCVDALMLIPHAYPSFANRSHFVQRVVKCSILPYV